MTTGSFILLQAPFTNVKQICENSEVLSYLCGLIIHILLN